jgi:hypothetical protein
VLTAAIFDDFVDQILDIAKRAASALEAAGVPYRVVGGFAVFLHIDAIDPMAARTARSSKGVLIAPVAHQFPLERPGPHPGPA